MPAVRPRGDIIDHLNASAPTRAADNSLPITAYFRSCDLLLSQAAAYRGSGQDEQLYVMLMRFASLVIETIPRHCQHSKESPQYKRYANRVRDVLRELEPLKLSLKLRNIEEPAARSINRPIDASRLVTSDLPDIDWGSVGADSSGTAAAAGAIDSMFGAEAAEWLARSKAAGPAGTSSGGFGTGGYGGSTGYSSGTAAAYGAPPALGTGSVTSSGSYTGGSSYQSSYIPSSQTAVDKHSLFAPRGPASRGAPSSVPRPRYPDFDRTPAASIDLLWKPQQQDQQQQDGAASPSAPPDDALAALELADRRASGAGAGGSLMDAPLVPRPSAGPSLGPQEMQVLSMDASSSHPGGTCAQAGAAAQQQLAVVEPGGGVKPLEKRLEMRDVHVSVALMNDFLHYASGNTRRGIESCGILAGTLSAGDSIFRVTTLIIPKQEGTTDTVSALNEEEIYEAQASRELYPLGWIHTHPTQTCFLSSVDVHTQCGYQTMLDEAVAIVMAPTDRRNKCGIFRLTTPGGLRLVQQCPLRGFHMHPETHTGQEVYELCGHVYLNPRTKHEVLDLR